MKYYLMYLLIYCSISDVASGAVEHQSLETEESKSLKNINTHLQYLLTCALMLLLNAQVFLQVFIRCNETLAVSHYAITQLQ